MQAVLISHLVHLLIASCWKISVAEVKLLGSRKSGGRGEVLEYQTGVCLATIHLERAEERKGEEKATESGKV